MANVLHEGLMGAFAADQEERLEAARAEPSTALQEVGEQGWRDNLLSHFQAEDGPLQ